MSEPRYYTQSGAAWLLGVSRQRVGLLWKEGKLPPPAATYVNSIGEALPLWTAEQVVTFLTARGGSPQP